MPIGGIYGNATKWGSSNNDVTDPSGSTSVAGTATTDRAGNFAFTWKPSTVGDYAISS